MTRRVDLLASTRVAIIITGWPIHLRVIRVYPTQGPIPNKSPNKYNIQISMHHFWMIMNLRESTCILNLYESFKACGQYYYKLGIQSNLLDSIIIRKSTQKIMRKVKVNLIFMTNFMKTFIFIINRWYNSSLLLKVNENNLLCMEKYWCSFSTLYSFSKIFFLIKIFLT